MDPEKPKISILCPVLNGAKFIRQTLDTVISQTFHDWELIAMDGGSKDGTLEILYEYAQKYPSIRVFSSPDESGFHAITKASQHARGEFIYMLCVSDGYLDNEWFAKCMEIMKNDPEVSLVWGIPFDMSEDGKLLGPHYIFAHFLSQGHSFKKTPIFKRVIKKIDLRRPLSAFEFLSKINSKNVALLRHILKAENPPQKQDWFSYWLKTGTIFPDGNMCVSRKAFFEHFPSYRTGTHESGDFGKFYFGFNAGGYLSHCIPYPANFGRTHSGQVGEMVRKYNTNVQRGYLRKIDELRKKLSFSQNEFLFRDRDGNPISNHPKPL